MDWLQLHDCFYRRVEFSLLAADPGNGLGRSQTLRRAKLISHCPNAGPVAVYHKSTAQHLLSIFSLGGIHITSIQLDTNDHLIAIGWIQGERLLCITEDGFIRVYSNDLISGKRPQNGIPAARQISLGVLENSGDILIDGRITWLGSLAILCSDLSFYIISNVDDENPMPRKYPTGGMLADLPNDWQILEPKKSRSGRPIEILVCGERSILNFDGRDKTQYSSLASFERFQFIRLSSDQKLISLLDANGTLLVVSADFERILLEFSIKQQKSLPVDMAWCGSDSVCLLWEDQLQVIGPYGDSLRFWLDEGAVQIFTESDGLRLFSAQRSEFLEKVPDVTKEVFKVGSTSPAALLLHAYELFEKSDPKADDIIRNVRPQLSDAVDRLINAAAHEYSKGDQKSLLNAAAFGKAFLDYYPPEYFMKACKSLRIMNALRDSSIGLPITYEQYNSLGPNEIIRRLCARNQHLLAFRVAEYLKLSVNTIINDWVAKKIQIQSTKVSDAEFCEVIFEQLGQYRGIAVAEIAMIAYKSGRPGLASKILEYEKRVSEQIPLLLNMQENTKALMKATEGGDADLVYMVLMDLKRRLSAPDFFRMISDIPVASNLLRKYLRRRDPESLKTFFYQEDRRYENACLVQEMARDEKDPQEMITKMKSAGRLLTGKKDYAFKLKMVEDEVSLIEQQIELEKEHMGHQFGGLSLAATISKLYIIGKPNKALKLKNEFRISEKRFWCIRITAFAETHDWDSLEKLAASKRTPVGYMPFVDACFKNGNILESKKYILKSDANLRAEMYIKLGLFIEASEAAFLARDIRTLVELRDKYRNRVQLNDLDRMINELRIK